MSLTGKLTVPLTLSRLWLLVLIDTASRAVLGYHLSLAENYSQEDVLECLGRAVTPWEPISIQDSRVSYCNGAGLPSGVLDACAWRAFNIIQFDNAWAHTSKLVQERIMSTFRCEVITNRPRRPRSNQIVERFMATFEQTTLHRWPSTTGSHINDPRRSASERAAKQLCAGYDDVRVAADLAIANYNAAPHGGLSGLSPLEFLAQRLDRGYDLVRHTEARQPETLNLFEQSITKKVRANPEFAHYPYINFHKARYSSDVLAASPELIDESVQFRVNVKDIRTAEVFHKGRSIGQVFANEKWMRHPHSLKLRKEINKRGRQRRIDWSTENPVGAHLEYLRERQKNSRRDRNRFLRAQREAKTELRDGNKPQRMGHRQPWSQEESIHLDTTHITR